MAQKPKCPICEKPVDKQLPHQKHGSRYYHEENCFTIFQARKLQKANEAKSDRTVLFEYLCELYETKSLNFPGIAKQIAQYKEEYNFTEKGIEMALRYFYEIQENPVVEQHKGISIVPYIYEDARNYYASLTAITNKALEVGELNNEVEVIYFTDKKPRRKRKKYVDIEEL